MAKRIRALTAFGRDLDSLLRQAGISSIREYADACGVNYKYLSQLRTNSERRPGGLYVDLLKPFTRLEILDIIECHKLSSRHRGKHLSFAECRELFPGLSGQDILESVKQASEVIDQVSTALYEPEEGYQGSPDTDQDTARRELLYRNIFVGRQAELSTLINSFDAAAAGQGSLVMIAGEPGIGKTAICEQLSTYVISRGGKTLWGHCYEEGSLSLPYLAFVEAMRSYVLDRETDDLRKELGSGVSDLARIVSEIREKLNIEPREAQNPEEDRYRLLQAVSSFLTNAAAGKPMCVILEDLHDADKGTLEMLSYVSRNVGSARLLLIGTYRDVKVDQSHPLSAALAELRRISSFKRILLRGLTIDEVRRMLAGITQEDIPVSVAKTLHRQTEGNPLFVQEVVRYLVEQDLFIQKEGQWLTTKDTSLEMSIPEGLRDVIGKRLTLLSNECNQLLSTAAVIGREFRLELLQKIAGISDDELINGLAEAKKAAVLEERSGLGAAVTYRFAHAFFRQTLYEEMIAPRRIRLHQQVAKALEEIYANRLAEHAAELAEHFSHSSDPTNLEKAVNYGEMAAKRASDVYAYGESVRLLEQAIKVQEIFDWDDKEKRYDLLMALCEAFIYAGEPEQALDTKLLTALSLAEDLADRRRASRVCYLACQAGTYQGSARVSNAPLQIEWAKRADRYAEPDTIERSRADAWMGQVKWAAGDRREGCQLIDRSLELARRLGDPDTFWWVAGVWIYFVGGTPELSQKQLQLAEELIEESQAGVSLWTLGWTLMLMSEFFLIIGHRQQFEEVYGQLQSLAERSQQANCLLWSMAAEGIVAILDGCFEDAIQIARRIEVRGQELILTEFAHLHARRVSQSALLYLRNDDNSLRRILEEILIPHGRLLLLAHLGRNSEAIEILDQSVVARPNFGSAKDETQLGIDIDFLEGAVLVGHRKAADMLSRRLADTARTYTCASRQLGAAGVLLERYDEARNYYIEAIRVCTAMKHRPEVALTRLQLAELLLDHFPDEKTEALEHLEFAIKEFREMKMQPSLEKALRRKDILKA